MSNFFDHYNHMVEVEVREVVRYDVINEKVLWQMGVIQGAQTELLGVYCRSCDVEISGVTLEYDDETEFSAIKLLPEGEQ
jgi:hypothetical protein